MTIFARLDALDASVAALATKIADLGSTPDLSDIDAKLDGLRADVDELKTLGASLPDLTSITDRLDVIEGEIGTELPPAA